MIGDDLRERCIELAIRAGIPADPQKIIAAAARFERHIAAQPEPLDSSRENGRYVAEIDRWLYWHPKLQAWATFAPEDNP